MAFRVQWRGRRMHVRIDSDGLTATLEQGDALDLFIDGATHSLARGETRTVALA